MRAADSRPYDVSPRRFETARPGGRALRKGRNPLAWAGEDTRPYGKTGNGSFFLWGLDTGRPAGGLWPRTSSVTLRVTPSPKGEGFRATARVAPTPGNGPGALVRQSQARLWNRIRPKFLHTQGPVARIEWQKATQILRAGNFLAHLKG